MWDLHNELPSKYILYHIPVTKQEEFFTVCGIFTTLYSESKKNVWNKRPVFLSVPKPGKTLRW